jgi:hypothetical protein
LGDSNLTHTASGLQLPSTPNSATPSDLDFNSSYANTAGAAAKQMIKLYYDGASCFGLGVSAGQLEIMTYTGLIHAFYNGTTLVAQFNASGNLGVGVTPTSYKVDVNGQVHATCFPTSSDIRFKKKITHLENSLEKVKKLQGVKYEWNEFINTVRDGYELNVSIIGLIAQDVEKIVPEVVKLWELNDDLKDARSIDYPRLIPLLIEAIKEQQAVIENQNQKIENLTVRMSALEAK